MSDLSQAYHGAVAHLSAGRLADAEQACRDILKRAPTHVDTLNLLGLALLRAGKAERALSSFKKALKAAPTAVPIHLNCGLAWSALDQREQAEQCFKTALSHDPASAEAHLQLGLLLHGRFKFADAAKHFRQVLAIDARHATAHALLGEALVLTGAWTDARTHLLTAIEINPRLTSAYDNLALLAENDGRTDEALAWFDKALAVNPDAAGARFNRAVILLRRGALERGLADYEWRWRTAKTKLSTRDRAFGQPLWQGEPLAGRRLLVWGEQGVGDEIRTAGLVADLAARGEALTLECDKRLVALFARSLPSVTVVARREKPARETQEKNIAFQAPAESLLRFTRPTLNDFPDRHSFLAADAARTSAFRDRFPRGKPVIGLSWGSYNPQLQLGKTTALKDWTPILNNQSASFVALQYGDIKTERDDVERAADVSMTLLPDLDLIKDIDGLAALIKACDLVITVSNTTAHLAGALGVPTWVLLPFGHFQPWYWFSERTDSPWYPSVRLYRQRHFGDWPHVIGRVAEDLKTWSPTSP